MGITDLSSPYRSSSYLSKSYLDGSSTRTRGRSRNRKKRSAARADCTYRSASHPPRHRSDRSPGHITNRKLSLVVRTGSTDKWDRRKGGILQIRMHTDRNTRHRLQILGVQQDSGHLHTVDGFAGREREGIILQYILLIIIGDRIGKVYRIGRILLQRIHQLDDRLPAVRPDNGLLHLGWSDDHVLGRLIDLDQLIKNNLHLLSLIVYLVSNGVLLTNLGGASS